VSAAGPSAPVVRLLVALLCLVWGSTWWAIRISLEDLPPCTAAAVRFLLAGLLMCGVASALRRNERAEPPPAWLWVSMSAGNFALSYGVIYLTETVVPSGIAAVLWAVFPLLMAVCGRLFLGERLAARQALGFVVAFAGTVTLYLGDLGGDRAAALPYALLLLLSPVAAAAGTTLVKRHGSHTSSLLLNRNAMLLGGVLLAAAAVAFERPAAAVWTTRAVVATLYLAVVGTVLTFGLYFWLLRWSSASQLSLIAYVTPCLALLFGWALGDGALDAVTLLGAVAIAAGIALVVRRDSRAASR
jgi:drug/metabolite transporter (DMT)-like permease